MTIKYSYEKVCKVFQSKIPRSTFNSFIERGVFPKPHVDAGKIKTRYWTIDQLPELGRIIGWLKDENKQPFLKTKNEATVITSYTRKGGVLKSTIAFNIARASALNGYRTLVIGLDSQCDITNMLGYYNDLNNATTAKEAEEILKTKKGLYDVATGTKLSEVIQSTDLPTLYFIPETDEIEELIEEVERATYREEWLKRNVIDKLKDKFDLIVIDSSPTSGRLVSNAMLVSDMIVSPLECSTNNFKNYVRTRMKIEKKLQELGASHIAIKHIPTKLQPTSISQDIYRVYQTLPACSINAIKTSTQMDSAVYEMLSIMEYAPTEEISSTTREVIREIFSEIDAIQKKRALKMAQVTSNLDRQNIDFDQSISL